MSRAVLVSVLTEVCRAVQAGPEGVVQSDRDHPQHGRLRADGQEDEARGQEAGEPQRGDHEHGGHHTEQAPVHPKNSLTGRRTRSGHPREARVESVRIFGCP